MQYASGGEIYDYVSYHKVLTDSDARRLFRQIATAIYYCHKVTYTYFLNEEQTVHSDISFAEQNLS